MTIFPALQVRHGWLKPEFLSDTKFSFWQDNSLFYGIDPGTVTRLASLNLNPRCLEPVGPVILITYSMEFTIGLLSKTSETRDLA